MNSQIRFIYDRLYKQIKFTAYDLKLFQTRELARLRHVSLSAIPTWIVPTGTCATKFEHSVGVAHLAKLVSDKPEFRDIAKDLYFSALAHDIGTPPFSHASEYFQVKLTGKNHEEFVEEIIGDSEFAQEVKKQGGNIDRINSYIKGADKPLSDLINGSIDIDNLDNSLRFGLSMGLFSELLYSPEELAQAYAVRDNKLVLREEHSNDIDKWEKTREIVYDFVYGDVNLSTGTMLFRAIDFAARVGEINRDYFLMTDNEAFNYLGFKCNSRTGTLIERAYRWIFYPRVYNFRNTVVSEKLIKFVMDSDNRGKLADEISVNLKIPPEDVCVYMGRDKGYKRIHLPIVGRNGDRQHQPRNQQAYMIQVYIHPKWNPKEEFIKQIVDNKLF